MWITISLTIINANYLINRAILGTTNSAVDKINEEFLKVLPTKEQIYYSADGPLDVENESLYQRNF